MSCCHNHEHNHSHHHHHHHEHDEHHEHHEIKSNLSFEEKMIKLFEHWIKHNSDHAQTYKEWAEKADENKMQKVQSLLKEVTDMTLAINRKFEEAAEIIKNKK